ncbi:hypothetical protein [Blastococcus sp. Marseille-P5729]|uniref:hypothetical protein n=1 Tax=Blastococcus sp. Marseille-P5729 TaxID=2086582 RepID=UPI000D0F62C8|nr:hypothetical protein [Blastococcus sp. Marseille-P5729]
MPKSTGARSLGYGPEQLAEIFASRARDERADHFAGTGACVTPVLDFTEAARAPGPSGADTDDVIRDWDVPGD